MDFYQSKKDVDAGLFAFLLVVRIYQIPVNTEQLYHLFWCGGLIFSEVEVVQPTRHLELKAQTFNTFLDKLSSPSLLSIYLFESGAFIRFDGGKEVKSLFIPGVKANQLKERITHSFLYEVVTLFWF
ncbi:hypothetical protein [Microbulbifer sp. GL-2]|uniref:hypothetical protein n=1 Tax=Microbulbifer sp. GL-2 TaxID=2591606 RepID=UPI00116263E4|nr:hypothetical protein [Microbulbifer sp. GL-2]BBM04135.1 hypothetical protein GL2_42090 [Microbulbifer sp. GL-2]